MQWRGKARMPRRIARRKNTVLAFGIALFGNSGNCPTFSVSALYSMLLILPRPTSMTFGDSKIDTLLDHYPGPVMIGISITRYLLAVAGMGAFIAAGIWFIHSARTLAPVFNSPHAPFRGEGFLYLLITLRLARDMPQAISELGWFAIALFGFGALAGTLRLVSGVIGLSGLTLDKNGFIVKGLKRNIRHDWADVGDFDTMKLPKTVRRSPLSRRCVTFNDYRAPETPIEWLRLTGRNRVLLESYEYPAEVLAPAMSIWRERALRDRAGRP